jgi:hypothetical protein
MTSVPAAKSINIKSHEAAAIAAQSGRLVLCGGAESEKEERQKRDGEKRRKREREREREREEFYESRRSRNGI